MSSSERGSAAALTVGYRFIQTALAAVFFLSFSASGSAGAGTVAGRVRWVVDGDTVVMESGEKVRYVGVDTPERGEPFYEEARQRNISMVTGKAVRIEVCGAEPRDRYGRLLAFVYAGGLFVNRALVEEGLARSLIIPPCGLPVAEDFKALESRARKKGLGLWAPKRSDAPPNTP